MLGRGILINPFLLAEIKGTNFYEDEKRIKLIAFHQRIFELYSEKMDNEGNFLNKMKQFWIYFSYNFSNQHKVLKAIIKSNSITRYKAESQKIFGFK